MAETNDSERTFPDINLDNIREVNAITDSHPKVSELPPLSRVGFFLSKFILFIISGYILFIIIFLLFSGLGNTNKIEINHQGIISDSLFSKELQAFQVVATEQQHNKDFVLQISQLILLNLLLPILTAILGYIFGSKEGSKNRE